MAEEMTPQKRGALTRAKNRRLHGKNAKNGKDTNSPATMTALFGVVATGKKGPGGTVTIPGSTYAMVKEALGAVLR